MPRSPSTPRIPRAASASGGTAQMIYAADLQRLADDIGLPVVVTDLTMVAHDLEQAAQHYTMFSRAEASATPGEAAAWCEGLLRHVDGLLTALGADARGDVHAPHHAMVSLAAGADEPDWLRDTMRGRAFGYDDTPDIYEDLLRAIDALRLLRRQAEIASRHHRAVQQPKRRPAWAEIMLFGRMDTAFKAAFGRELKVSVSTGAKGPAGAVSGDSIEFCAAVLKLIRERYTSPDDADGPQRDVEWLHRLNTLRQSKHAIANRIRDIRSGGLVRKR